MSENLTDEKLREIAARKFGVQPLVDMATEIIALRAERAKPTQSDDERAQRILNYLGSDDDAPGIPFICAHFASIRAEGRAEREKLEGELGYARTWIASSVRHHQRDSMLARIDRALAQPAESGATEPCEWPKCGCRNQTDAECWRKVGALHRHLDTELPKIKISDDGTVACDAGAKP